MAPIWRLVLVFGWHRVFFVSGALKLTHWQTALSFSLTRISRCLDVLGERWVRRCIPAIRKRFATMMNWFWAYLTFSDGTRLITGANLQTGQAPLYQRDNGRQAGIYEQSFTHRSRKHQASDTGC